MSSPKLTILGVYKPDISPAVYQEQWDLTESDEQTNQHFAGLVLIEALLEDAEGQPPLEDYGQPHPDGFQCAYDEALLSFDGELLIDRKIDCVYGTGPLRFAFYLHYYDPEKPLHWDGGQLICPPIQPMPARLLHLVPYNPCS